MSGAHRLAIMLGLLQTSTCARTDTTTVAETQLFNLIDQQWREDERSIDKLIESHGCKHFYIDVGTHAGVQLRKLFEPHAYPDAPVHTLFNKHFPARRCAVCAIGFEPSSSMQTRLDALEMNYTAAGIGVLIFRAAASTSGGAVYFGGSGEGSTVGHMDISMNSGQHTAASYNYVRSIGLEHVIRYVRGAMDRREAGRNSQRARLPRGKIVMKVDVEAQEWLLMPQLILSETLCQLDAVYIEYHWFVERPWFFSWAQAASKAFQMSAEAKHCNTELINLDDETYASDKRPFPSTALCKRNVLLGGD